MINTHTTQTVKTVAKTATVTNPLLENAKKLKIYLSKHESKTRQVPK